MDHKILFTPLAVGAHTIKNRFIMCPMAVAPLYSLDGSYMRDIAEYYVRRAKVGVGMIVTRAITVCPLGLEGKLYDKRHVFEPLRNLTREVHQYHCKIIMQLSAGGGRIIHASEEEIRKRGLRFEEAFKAPSDDVPNIWDESIKHKGMSREEISEYIHAFAEMAQIAKDMGFDGVEVHAVHEEFLMDQFTLKYCNKRTDEYGGEELENRFRFPCEVIKAIRKKCGKNFIISMRYGITSKMKSMHSPALPNAEFKEFGRNIDEGIAGAKLLEAAGCDMLSTDNGTTCSWYWAHPPVYMPYGCNLEESRRLSQQIHIPVICAGRMDDMETMVKALEGGIIDGIGLGRALLADPDYVNKVKEKKTSDIKPCIACHKGCLEKILTGQKASCAVNPEVLNEGFYENMFREKTGQGQSVAVIGGGISGMQAAILLSQKGFSVTIYEQNDYLGGIYVYDKKIKAFGASEKLLNWFKHTIGKYPITVHYNTYVEDISMLEEDVVVCATGAKRSNRKIKINVDYLDILEYLGSGKTLGDTILVLGSGMTEAELACHLARTGKSVTLCEKESQLTFPGKVQSPNKKMLLDMMDKYKITVLTSSKLEKAERGTAYIIINNEDKVKIKCDNILGLEGYSNGDVLTGTNKSVYRIGGCKSPGGSIMEAIADAYETVKEITEVKGADLRKSDELESHRFAKPESIAHISVNNNGGIDHGN